MGLLTFLGLEKHFGIQDPDFAPYFEKAKGIYGLKIESMTKNIDGQNFVGPCLVFWNKRNMFLFQRVVKEITIEQATEAKSFDDLFSNPRWIANGIQPQILPFHPANINFMGKNLTELNFNSPNFSNHFKGETNLYIHKRNEPIIKLSLDLLDEKLKNAQK